MRTNRKRHWSTWLGSNVDEETVGIPFRPETKCAREGRHKIKPRYEEGYDLPDALRLAVLRGTLKSLSGANAAPYKRYVCDVCVWCGATIER